MFKNHQGQKQAVIFHGGWGFQLLLWCCGSRMFIPDPDFSLSQIRHKKEGENK
jgi:hypothetical protein